MSRLYRRKAQLLVGKREAEGKNIEGVRISFDISMNDSKETNTGTVEVYNLSDETIGLLEQKDAFAILKIGYGDDIPSTIFLGDIVTYAHDYKGSDIITKITLKDGYVSLLEKRVSLSFSGNSNTKQILDKIVSDLNLIKPNYSDLPNYIYKQGFSFSGYLGKALTIILNRIGHEWTISNNVLIISEPNKPKDDAISQYLSPETGLINKPKRLKETNPLLQSGNKKLIDGWSFESLIIPSILPKSLIKVSSRDINGIFLVKSCRFVGDTGGETWVCKIDSIQI